MIEIELRQHGGHSTRAGHMNARDAMLEGEITCMVRWHMDGLVFRPTDAGYLFYGHRGCNVDEAPSFDRRENMFTDGLGWRWW